MVFECLGLCLIYAWSFGNSHIDMKPHLGLKALEVIPYYDLELLLLTL